MNDDELINRLLNDLYSAQREVNVYGYMRLLNIDNKTETTRIIKLMKAYNIAEPTKNYFINITDFGMLVCKKGGWLEHLKQTENEHLQEIAKLQLEIDGIKSTINVNKLSKWDILLTAINLLATLISVLIAIKSK